MAKTQPKPHLQFAQEDDYLHKTLARATPKERREFEQLLRKKVSCDLPKEPTAIDLAAEFQLMGGHTLANLTRGHGVTYEEIVKDVADRVLKGDAKKRSRQAATVIEREKIIVESLLAQAMDRMTAEQREEFTKEVNKQARRMGVRGMVGATPSQALLRIPGMGYPIIRLIAVTVLKRLSIHVAATTVTGKVAAILAGPVGWVVASLLVALDVMGPAYTVTVPGVLLVTAMRARQIEKGAVYRLQRAAAEADAHIREVTHV